MTAFENFIEAKKIVLTTPKTCDSIGLLQEKSVHATLKLMYERDETCHEVKIGDYYADVFIEKDSTVVEIQTRQFYKLKDKLDYFLSAYKVVLVHPIIEKKTIVTLDEERFNAVTCLAELKSEDFLSVRKSPKKRIPQNIFQELYRIKPFLLNKNFSVNIVMMSATEYRTKKRKLEIVPDEARAVITLEKPSDYLKLLPEDLPTDFTTKDLKAILGPSMAPSEAQAMANILTHFGILKKIGKQGRMYLYQKNPNYST